MVLVFLKMKKEVGEDSPSVEWVALFQRDDGRGSDRARLEAVPCFHSDSKSGTSHICEINDILNSSGLVALSIQKL